MKHSRNLDGIFLAWSMSKRCLKNRPRRLSDRNKTYNCRFRECDQWILVHSSVTQSGVEEIAGNNPYPSCIFPLFHMKMCFCLNVQGFELLCTKTRFETEGERNSEMIYLFACEMNRLHCVQVHFFVNKVNFWPHMQWLTPPPPPFPLQLRYKVIREAVRSLQR